MEETILLLQNTIDFFINRLIRDLPEQTRITISIVLFLVSMVYFYFFVTSIRTGAKASKDTAATVGAKYALLVI